jgi:NADH dehydrogenase
MKRVVVVGGGYGGAKAVVTLSHSKGCEVVLIDRNRFHYRQAELHEFISSAVPLERVLIDLAGFARRQGARFIHASLDRIDEDRQQLYLSNQQTLAYDALIVATGAATRFPAAIEGIKTHTKDIKNFAGAFYNRQRFEQLLFRERQAQVVVGGAGLSGVEIAAEMAHRARQLGRGADELSITLIEPLETVLPGMDPFLIRQAKRALERLGVVQLHGRYIAQVEADRVVLSDQGVLPCDLFIFTGGVVPNSGSCEESLPRGEQGEAPTDEALRIVGTQSPIFAVGDMAILKNPLGEIQPPTSQTAKQSGHCAAQNVLALLSDRPLKPCRVQIQGVMVALGGKEAAGILWGWLRLKGRAAHELKRLIFWLHARSFR